MSTDLAVIPWTGEALNIRRPSDALRGLQQAKDFRPQLSEFTAACTQTLVEEADRQGLLGFNVDGVPVRVTGPGEEVEYDVQKLLAVLATVGVPVERIEEAVRVVFKPDQRVLNQLSRNPEYAAAIESAIIGSAPKRRRVEKIG